MSDRFRDQRLQAGRIGLYLLPPTQRVGEVRCGIALCLLHGDTVPLR